MPSKVVSLIPQFGENYDIGYIGFSFTSKSFVSRGIAFFERFDRYSDIPVSHCLMVTASDKCIEALTSGVKITPLRDYFESPHTHLFFRKPRYYSPDLALSLQASAMKHVGHKYDWLPLIAHAFKGTIAGQILNRVLFNLPMRFLSRVLNSTTKDFCSELIALCMQEQRVLRGLGCLMKPASIISPQMLFEDSEVFVPWKVKSASKK